LEGEAPAEPNAHPQMAQISQIRSDPVSESVQSAQSVDQMSQTRLGRSLALQQMQSLSLWQKLDRGRILWQEMRRIVFNASISKSLRQLGLRAIHLRPNPARLLL
jgi:hypothetical protein